MEVSSHKEITHEKHLDHMVKVVPFIVFLYAVHAYYILNLSSGSFSKDGSMYLGGFLATLILIFVSYDLNHKATLTEKTIHTSFLGITHQINFCDILEIMIHEPDQSFSTLTFKTSKGHFKLYFVDEAEKIKEWVLTHQNPQQYQKAA